MMLRVKRLLLCALLLLAGYAQAGEADLLARIGGQTREIERLNALPACAPMDDVLADILALVPVAEAAKGDLRARLAELVERRRNLEEMLAVHRPDLRRGEALWAEFDAWDFSGLEHATYRGVVEEIETLQRRDGGQRGT